MAARSRRRVRALTGGSGVAAPAALVRHLGTLELPGGPERWAARLPGLALGTLVVLVLIGGPRLAAAASLGTAGAFVWARRSAPARRAALVDAELPLVLEAVARHLRAGASLHQAIPAATPPPRAAAAMAWPRLVRNLPLVGAAEAADRWVDGRERPVRPSERLAAAALALAADTGGSPARALDGVAATLRARLAVGDEARALSSQARLSAAVIAVAPLLFGIGAATTESGGSFFGSAPGAVVLATALGLDAAGFAWMRRLCRSGDG